MKSAGQLKVCIDKENVDLPITRLLKKLDLNIPYSTINKLIRKKQVLVNGKKVENNYRTQINDVIEIFYRSENRIKIQKEVNNIQLDKLQLSLQKLIIFEHDDWLILNKPANVPVQKGTSSEICIIDAINRFIPTARLVHRLDKETSGILVIAKTLEGARKFHHFFKTRLIDKEYTAIICGNLQKKSGTISKAIEKGVVGKSVEKMVLSDNEKELAITDYKLINKIDSNHMMVLFKPITGKKHQIRVHASLILETPILGDIKYGGEKYKNLCLHASRISFVYNDKKYSFEANLPDYFDI